MPYTMPAVLPCPQNDWTDPIEQVASMERIGVAFELWDKGRALRYLSTWRSFRKLSLCLGSFRPVAEGPDRGRYHCVDFAMLVDLLELDRWVWGAMLPLTLDLEEAFATELHRAVADGGVDPARLVRDYLAIPGKAERALGAMRGEAGVSASCPEFIDGLMFGPLLDFGLHAADCLGNKRLRNRCSLLLDVKNLRNACAHREAVFGSLVEPSRHRPGYALVRFVSAAGVSKGVRDSRMRSKRLLELSTTLFAHRALRVEGGFAARTEASLRELGERMVEHLGYYRGSNEHVASSLRYARALLLA